MAQKGYAMPTKASKMKTKGIDPAEYTNTYKEKTAVERINSLLKDTSVTKTLETKQNDQVNPKIVEGLQAQIDALRSAFTTLADVVVEEMNRTKQEMMAEASIIARNGKVNDTLPVEPDLNKISLDLSTVQQQTRTKMERIEGGVKKDIECVKNEVEIYKQDTQ